MERKLDELEILKRRISRFVDFTKFFNISEEEKQQLDYFKNNDIFIKRQFVDSEFGLSEIEYNRWLKNAKNQYFYTILAASLLTGSKSLSQLQYKHSAYDELEMPVLEGYSPRQILKTLNLLDIPTIMLLTTEDVVMKKGNNNYRLIFGRDGWNKIYSYCDFGSKVVKIEGLHAGQKYYSTMNANEFLFRKLRLPISIILNSTNTVIDYYQLPDEGISNCPINEKLCDDIQRIRRNEKYKEFIR